jgi:hypothetical protein
MNLQNSNNSQLYYWSGYVVTEYGNSIKKHCIGPLKNVSMELAIHFPNKVNCPQIFCISSTRELTEEEMNIVEETRKTCEDI